MALETLEIGQSVAGLLVDGVESTAYTGATLKHERPSGLIVEVPFVYGDPTEQFSHVADWFNNQQPPTNMWLMTHEGTVGLYGVRWRGHSMKSGVSLGKLSPREALFGSSTAAI